MLQVNGSSGLIVPAVFKSFESMHQKRDMNAAWDPNENMFPTNPKRKAVQTTTGGDRGKVAEESELGPRQSRAAAILCDVISFNASISSCERTSVWQPALGLVQCMDLWFIQSSIISFNAPCKNMVGMGISGSVSGSKVKLADHVCASG